MWERMWFEVINQSGVGQWLQSPLERVSDFSKISYKTKNLLKKKEKKKKNCKLSRHRRQATASDPNEPNSVSKTETNIPQKQVNPPDEGFLLLYKEFNNLYTRGYLQHFATPPLPSGIY